MHGFSLPVSPEIVPDIANAMVQPAGVVKQFSSGRVPSLEASADPRLIVPFDFRGSVGKQRIDMSAYVEMIYGAFQSDTLHRRSPFGTPIDTRREYDYWDAYRRVAHSPTAA
jgi:hypothetical protein